MLGQDYRFNGTDIWMSISQQIAKFKTGTGKGKQFYLREICANPECLGMHILPHWQSHLAWSSLPERMRKDKSLMWKETWPSQAVGLQFYATALLQTPAPPLTYTLSTERWSFRGLIQSVMKSLPKMHLCKAISLPLTPCVRPGQQPPGQSSILPWSKPPMQIRPLDSWDSSHFRSNFSGCSVTE